MRVRSGRTSKLRRLNGFGVSREGGGADSPDPIPLPAPSEEPVFIPAPPPPPSPAPIPTPSLPSPSGYSVIANLAAEARAKLQAAVAVVNFAVGPVPIPRTLAELGLLRDWSLRLKAARATNPAVNDAVAFIESISPPTSDGSGFFSVINAIGETIVDGVKIVGGAIVRGVKTIGNAVGSVINFVAGGFPSPADYDPENLCVTAWTDPPKFALLSAVAAIVFPPALLYMGVYVPPNITGLTLGLAKSLAVGGPSRVISKILDPLYNSVKELAEALLDYAFNGTPALIRWAIRKVAERLPDDVLKGILLALSEAADSIVEVIKSAAALKDENFYAGLGDAIEKAGTKFFGENPGLRQTLTLIGGTIRGGGAAIAILIDKGIAGVQEAFSKLAEKVLGIPADFDRLSEKVRAEIANAKAKITEENNSPLDLFHMFVSNLKMGVAAVADALRKLPFKIGDILGAIVDALGELIARAEAFIEGLLALARRWREGAFEPPPPPVVVVPAPVPTPAPAGSGSGGSSLLFILGGGIAGALFGGPVGAAIGAAAGTALAPKKG